jgi:hypothetical protein
MNTSDETSKHHVNKKTVQRAGFSTNTCFLLRIDKVLFAAVLFVVCVQLLGNSYCISKMQTHHTFEGISIAKSLWERYGAYRPFTSCHAWEHKKLCVSRYREFLEIMLISVNVWFVLNLRTKVELTRSNAFATLSVRILISELNVDISTVIVPSHPSSLCIEVSQQCELNNGFIFLRMLTPHARGATQVG